MITFEKEFCDEVFKLLFSDSNGIGSCSNSFTQSVLMRSFIVDTIKGLVMTQLSQLENRLKPLRL